ncbi:HC-toxin synthetase [Penicillium angulare]|uniref:HC-toxin synthetase n=1 Tax=Penicillium angulare TaxID=116970 RepID=A0A9W9G6H1_9EURO|nr:HC-toxin synthetase [Penicillium angulare]
MKLKCRPIEQAKLGFGDIKSHIAGHLKVAEVVIEDVYPCTPLQEGMMALTAKRPGQYMRYWVFGLKENVDTDRFQHAWNGLAGQMSILRTRVIQILEREMLQVVLNYGPQWSANATEDIDEFLKEERLKPMGLGEPLVRFALVSREKTSERFFVLTMHHAVVDGVSIKILLESAEKLYHNQEVPDSAPFYLFLNHHRDIEIETARYWERKLEGSDPATFSKLPAQNYDPFANEEYRYHMKKAPRLCKDGIQLSTAIWASWAILQAHYTSSRDVVFGVPVSGRQRVPIQGIEKMVAPTVATVPIRAIVDWDITVGDFLQNLQTQTTDMLPFVQVGLRRLRQINPYGDQATRFQTIIGIQRRSVVHPEDDTIVRYDSARSARRLGLFHGNALMIECQIDTDGLYVQISFDSAVMNKSEIIRISQQLEQIVQQVCGGKSQSVLLRDVEILSAKDLQDLQQWNAERPVKINRFVDEIIAENFRARPSAPAICSWDGDLTYGQFDNVTTRLAAHLTKFGVGRGFIVPLCFRRSRWMFIAMLAVIKTGAAFVFLDESLPLARMREIFSQIAARIVLTSKRAHSNLSKLSTIHTIIAADSETWLENDRVSRYSCAEEVNLRGAISTPEDTLYIAFTSGSTGKPKGVVITHSSYASVSLAHKGPMGIDHTSRVLHFASYSFDASNFEALTTFIAGACLCIPSEAMRDNDLGTAINELQAYYMFLTPTVSRLLTPADVPSVKTLLTGGEIITKSDISFWSKHVHFKIAYGPTECSAICAVLPDVLDEDAGTIGRGTGASLWIVNPTDHRMLAPVGAVGELVLEGPVIGKGYLGNDEKMGKTFTDQPKWLSKVLPREKIANFPIYLTGDLVQQEKTGS